MPVTFLAQWGMFLWLVELWGEIDRQYMELDIADRKRAWRFF